MENEIEECLAVLKRGGTIVYPTDTVWGIGCDSTNPNAINRIFQIKNRAESKALICLVSDLKMLEQFVENIPNAAYDIIKFSNKPTTIIYDNPIRISENLIAEDDTLGIRIVKDEFCQKLIRKLRRPLVSTSANISGKPTPNSFSEIQPEILKAVDYVVNLRRSKSTATPSTIIKLGSSGKVEIIRK